MKTNLTKIAPIVAISESNEPAQKLPADTQGSDAMTRLLTHHLSSFQDNNLQALMSDYTEQSVLITADALYKGSTEIRTFFTALMPQFPKQGTVIELDKMTVVDDLLFIVWRANTPTLRVSLGSDTILVKQGKIHRQTFVGQMEQILPG
jgi:hypothetical protein